MDMSHVDMLPGIPFLLLLFARQTERQVHVVPTRTTRPAVPSGNLPQSSAVPMVKDLTNQVDMGYILIGRYSYKCTDCYCYVYIYMYIYIYLRYDIIIYVWTQYTA